MSSWARADSIFVRDYGEISRAQPEWLQIGWAPAPVRHLEDGGTPTAEQRLRAHGLRVTRPRLAVLAVSTGPARYEARVGDHDHPERTT